MSKILILFICYLNIFTTTNIRSEKISITPKVYPIKQMDKFHFGFSHVQGDLLWVRVLQNIDYCESKGNIKAVNTGNNMDEILAHKLSPSRCNKGWVFQMLDLITSLTPKFRKVYRVGAELLSVAVDDREGARIIFEKGLKVFPAYWELAYSASYHYLFEFQDPKRAAQLLVQSADAGGPFWFRQMAGTLYTKAGQYVMAEVTLKSYIEKYKGHRGVGQAEMRLKELRKMKKKIKSEGLKSK